LDPREKIYHDVFEGYHIPSDKLREVEIIRKPVSIDL